MSRAIVATTIRLPADLHERVSAYVRESKAADDSSSKNRAFVELIAAGLEARAAATSTPPKRKRKP